MGGTIVSFGSGGSIISPDFAGGNPIGIRDMYFDGGANHNIYGNATTGDATARSVSVNVLNSTTDAWLEVLRITPDAADPWASWGYKVHIGAHTEPTNMLKITGNMDVTGHIGIAVDQSADYGGYYSESRTDTANTEFVGFYSSLTVLKTTAAYTNVSSGYVSLQTVGATNDQNWSRDPIGLSGYTSYARVLAGATGIITGAADFYAREGAYGAATVTNRYGLYVADAAGAGTITNQYGVYIAALTKGATLDYAFYAAGGQNYLASGVRIGADSTDNLIDDASNGAASTTLYIGNKAILVANGVNFGPAAVASITVANGQITAIS